MTIFLKRVPDTKNSVALFEKFRLSSPKNSVQELKQFLLTNFETSLTNNSAIIEEKLWGDNFISPTQSCCDIENPSLINANDWSVDVSTIIFFVGYMYECQYN